MHISLNNGHLFIFFFKCLHQYPSEFLLEQNLAPSHPNPIPSMVLHPLKMVFSEVHLFVDRQAHIRLFQTYQIRIICLFPFANVYRPNYHCKNRKMQQRKMKCTKDTVHKTHTTLQSVPLSAVRHFSLLVQWTLSTISHLNTFAYCQWTSPPPFSPISACQVPPAGGGGGLLTKLRLARNKEGGLVKEEERERASEMRSLGGFRWGERGVTAEWGTYRLL